MRSAVANFYAYQATPAGGGTAAFPTLAELTTVGTVVEGNLQRLTRMGWQRAYPEELADRVLIVESSAAQTALLKSGYGEIWRTLAMAMLAALMLESILAWRFGRR